MSSSGEKKRHVGRRVLAAAVVVESIVERERWNSDVHLLAFLSAVCRPFSHTIAAQLKTVIVKTDGQRVPRYLLAPRRLDFFFHGF